MTSIAQQRRTGGCELLRELGRYGDSGLQFAYEGPHPRRGRIRIVPYDLLRVR